MLIGPKKLFAHPVLNMLGTSSYPARLQTTYGLLYTNNARSFTTAMPFSKDVDYYKVLGVKSSAKRDEIKKVYYALAKKHHPDAIKGKSTKSSEERFKKITEAYNVLSCEKTKDKYDNARRENYYSGQTTGMGGQGQQFYGNRESTYTYSAKSQ